MTIPPRALGVLFLAPALFAACSGSGGGGSGGIARLRDVDGDGLPDALERRLGSDARDADDPFLEGAQDDDTAGGPGPDAIPDGLERYLRAGGSISPITTQTDGDADGIPDYLEARSGSEPFDARDPAYARAYDLDGDQVPDWLELASGSDPLLSDFPTFDGADDDDGGALGPDGDGVTDGLEGHLFRAGAARPVTTATDSDLDGLADVAEVRAGTDPFEAASPVEDGAGDDDGDGIANSLEAVLSRKGARMVTRASDSDHDRIPDFVEVRSGSDPFERSDPTLFSHFDLDSDGLDDFLEYEVESDPLNPDSPTLDGALDVDDRTGPARDPISDALEELLIARGASAPATTYSDTDSDGVPDFVELRWVSDPLDPDSPVAGGERDEDDEGGPAGDGISDAAEQVMILLGAGGPLDAARNSDGDVIPDAIELVTGSSWLDTASPRPNRSPDIDGDGAVDYLELVLGFDPRSADDPLPAGGLDSDGDGLSDALEELLRLTSTPLPVTPESDSDGDGLYDYLEIALASERHDGHLPVQDGGSDDDDRTGPAGDGISDALEYFLIRSGAARPVSTRSDSDGDVIPDYLEVRLALDAFDPSSPLADGSADGDGDGVSNSLELVISRLGATPPIDGRTDSDLDGAPDHLEIFAGADAFDGDDPAPGGASDRDGDGLSDALELVLSSLGARTPVTPRSDTDEDGIPDGYEVRSGTHPLRGEHPLANGGSDVLDSTGPSDTISDALELLLVRQGALAPVTRGSDSDVDGAPDHLEVFASALPFDADDPRRGGAGDSDGDRLSDALEEVLLRIGGSPPLDTRSDTDRDGAPDFFEVETSAHPADADVPVADGAGAGFDVNATSGPNGDRVSDALELLLVQIGCPPPIRAESDTDLDGMPDAFEARSGTNPLDGDSPLRGGGSDADDGTGPPGDSISDALEVALIAQGASGPVTLATDTDSDGVPDFYEVFKGSDPFDAADAIDPGTKPRALELTITGTTFEGRTLRGSYRYVDVELDPEGPTAIAWLRDGIAIPGAIDASYVVAAADVGLTLEFEVTPSSRFAFPPETARGEAVRAAREIPVPTFPRGTGGPGGVGVADGKGNLRLWLRAGEGVVTEGAEVSRWMDQSGYGRDANEVDATRLPDLVSGVGPRLTEAVRFDGASHLFVSRPVEDDFSLLAVFSTTSPASNASWWLSPAILGGVEPLACYQDYHFGIDARRSLFVVENLVLRGNGVLTDGLPHVLLATRLKSSGKMRIFVDGATRGSADGQRNSLVCPTDLYVGSSTVTDGFWNGDLFEVCAFSRAHGELERNLIDNYLGARYGTTPIRTLFHSGLTHGGDVTGIGRESQASKLEEAEGPGILRIANPSALSDGDYLLWGTDRPDDFTLSTDVPASFPARLARTWAWTLTDGGDGDGVGTVNMRFRVKGLFLSSSAHDFALLFDDDGSFFDARVHPFRGLFDSALEAIEFFDVEPGPERYFALAVRPL